MNDETIGRPMEILLVEDSLTSARLTIGALKKGSFQHRLTWLTDGDSAIAFLNRQDRFARAPRPDLILLDLGLPKRDGRQVLQEIKDDSDLSSIPVVVLTASTSVDDAISSERLQVESHLTKPVNFGEFLEVVQKLNRYWHADMILPSSE
jgi:CheY-like chemotaxis protein